MAYNNYFPQLYPNVNPIMAPISQPTAQNGITWVQGESAAKSYPVGAGQSVLLMDSENPVMYIKNIAVPTDETAGPISVALAIDGEALRTSNAIVTPTVADAYFNVTSTAFITVPKGCCFSVSVENTSTISINMQNANLVVERVA